MLVHDVLKHKGDKVFTAAPETLARTLTEEFRNRRIGSAVVVDKWTKILGIVSERDIVYAIARLGESALSKPVAELMTTPAPTCVEDDRLTKVMALMTRRRVRHVAVLRDGGLAGIVSIGDVVKNRLDEIELEVNVLRDYVRAHP
jgi:signal-transduction protein with cAMP-binding, CBS, and nucleotidyltransferase domain